MSENNGGLLINDYNFTQTDIREASHEIILEYNSTISANGVLYTINDYLHKIHKKFYSTINIKTGLQLLNLMDKDKEFIIKFNTVEAMNVTKLKPKNIKNTIKENGLVEHVDYVTVKYSYARILCKEVYRNKYILTPNALKKCLLRLNNRYSNYFLFLEKVMYYYTDYQTKYNKKFILEKDAKINELLDIVERQEYKIKELARKSNIIDDDIDIILNSFDEIIANNSTSDWNPSYEENRFSNLSDE